MQPEQQGHVVGPNGPVIVPWKGVDFEMCERILYQTMIVQLLKRYLNPSDS